MFLKNSVRKKTILFSITIIILTSLLTVSAATPLITISKPATIYNVYDPSNPIVCEATVTGNTANPTISFNNTVLGNMTLRSGTTNTYYYNWYPTQSQRGFYTGTLLPLTVVAGGSSGGNSSYVYRYVSQMTKSQYDSLATSWSIQDVANTSYNCLSYALGITNTWTWPWNSSNSSGCIYITGEGYYPLVTTLDAYMQTKGHTKVTSASSATIIAYGLTQSGNTYATHFSKKTASSTTVAKWGQLEVMQSSSLTPYTSSSGYGSAIAYYN